MRQNELTAFWNQYQSVMAVYEAAAAQTGLSALQLTVLDTVYREPGCTQKRLCEATRLPKQRMNLIVRQLVRDGLLELRRSETDGRSKTLCFTEAGQGFASTMLQKLSGDAVKALSGEGEHVHLLEDGTLITHAHHHEHAHEHQNTKAVLDRLAKAIGHLEKVRNMVDAGVDCSEVLIQLAAVKSAINNTGKIILKDHIEHCLVDAIECGDTGTLTELQKAIDQFIK